LQPARAADGKYGSMLSKKVGGESGWGWLLAFCGKCRADPEFVASPMRASASMLTPPD
jgi:hypothetical protein